MEFRCVSTHPESLADGRVVGVGETVDLSREETQVSHNRILFAQDRFVAFTRTGEEIIKQAKAEGEEQIASDLHVSLVNAQAEVPAETVDTADLEEQQKEGDG